MFSSLYERFGLNAYVQGDPAKALAWFRKIEAVEPDSIRVLRNIGVILLASGDSAGAEAYLLREERLYGETYDRHSALADISYANGSRKEAARRYAAALADPETARGGRGAGSRHLLEERLTICSNEAAYQASRRGAERFAEAEAVRDSGDTARALSLFMEAYELDPTHMPALNNAGTLALNVLGDPAKALWLFEKALAIVRTPQVQRNAELARMALEHPATPRKGIFKRAVLQRKKEK